MHVSLILLAVSAATIFANGSAFSADTNPIVAYPDVGKLGVTHTTEDEKRSLRGLEIADDEGDEERLGGANMFNLEKLTKAMDDTNYATTLFRRWKRHGYDIKEAKAALVKSKLANDPRLNGMYHNYAAWLDKHYPLPETATSGGANLFAKTKIDEALKDSKYAKTLFGRWKSHGYESDQVFAKLETMGLKTGDDTFDSIYRNYLSWLNIHHPDKETVKLAASSSLFEEGTLLRARKDDLFAESLFRVWKIKRYNVAERLKTTYGNADGSLLKKYNTWLSKHFPPKAKITSS